MPGLWFKNRLLIPSLFVVFLTACDKAGDKAEAALDEQQRPTRDASMRSSRRVDFHIIGTTPAVAAGIIYKGNCDSSRATAADLDLMTFSTPASWKYVGHSGGSVTSISAGGDVLRSILFEKKRPYRPKARLTLQVHQERSDQPVDTFTSGLRKVTDIGAGPVALYWVDGKNGYLAYFPIARRMRPDIPDQSPEPELTGRSIAKVTFTAGSDSFDVWPETEIVALYESLYTERCLGDALVKVAGLNGFEATAIYE